MFRFKALLLCGGLAVTAIPTAGAAAPESWPGMLREGRYAELTARLSEAHARLEPDERVLWRAFKPLEKAPAELAPSFDKWVAATNGHGLALLARGQFFYGQGWSARGNRFTSETSQEQFARMNDFFARAKADLEAAKSKLEKCDLCYSSLISIAMAQGERDTKALLYNQAMQRNPMAFGPPLVYLGSLSERWGGRPGEAQVFVANFRRDYPSNPVLRALEAELLVEQGERYYFANQYSEAVLFYERALALDPRRSRTLYHLGYSYARLNQFDKALKAADQSIAIDAADKGPHQVRGWALMRLERGAEALPALLRATELGDAWSLRQALQVYAHGKYGQKKNHAKTWQLCDAGARAGIAEGYGCLGGHYYHGYHVKADHAEAARWFRIAADRGQHEIMTDLGIMYWSGDGVPKDEKIAIGYWRKAAAAGDKRAEEKLKANLSWWRYFWEVTWEGWTRSTKEAMSAAGSLFVQIARALAS